MKAIAICLIFSLAVMSIHTQAPTKKPKAKASLKVHVKGGAKSNVKAPKAKAGVKIGLKGGLTGKKTTGKAKTGLKVNIKTKGKKPAAKKPTAKAGLHMKVNVHGKAKAPKTTAKGKLGAHMKIKIHGKAKGKAKKATKKASLCTAKLNVFGLKMIQGNAITKDTACGLKESCVTAADFKAATAKVNAFANKLGSWIWSKQTLAKWINFAMTKVDYVKAAKMCGVTVPAKKTDAKKTDKKDTKKPAAKKDDKKKPAAKKDDKKAKKDEKSKRRMQTATKTSGALNDAPSDVSSKDAGVTKVEVKPAPGQETPFDASAKLISLSFVTALLVAFM